MNTLIAQTMPDWTPLAGFGLGGVLSTFLMYWMVTWGRRMEEALNRVARANSLIVISLKQAHEEAKRQAQDIIAELDQSERRE